MRHLATLLLLLVLPAALSPAQAQSVPFDVAAYRAFLDGTDGLDTHGLLARHPAGVFEDTAPGRFDAALYSDSIDVWYTLTDPERDLLDRHGFMVTERLAPGSFGDGFLDIFKKDLPVFVSTDAILHALHMSYDRILMDAERSTLRPALEALLAGLHAALPDLTARYAGTPALEQPLRDVDVYLSVPRLLLDPEAPVPIYEENAAVVDELLDLIAAEQAVQHPLFSEACRVIDFSQFTPRGHYTQEPELTQYFQAMIWLGRTELYLIAPATVICRPTEADVQRQAIVAALLTEAAALDGNAARLTDIESLLGLFVGEADNVTADQLAALLDAAALSDAATLAGAEAFAAFQTSLAEQPFAFQRINSQILFSNDVTNPDAIQPASAFMLLGQRFVIDAYVTGHVVFDEVLPTPATPEPRMLPSTLDVLFALGNDAAGQLLTAELDRFGYAEQLAALRFLVDSYDDADFWNATLYNGWLDAIRTLSPPSDRSGLPAFMQTAAWWQEKMNTQLAAWAQLRHDNLLYAKQSYTGAITCMYPYSYVEPIPAFYDAIGRLTDMAAERFGALTTPDSDRIARFFTEFHHISDTLGAVTRKELDGTPLSPDEVSFLQRMMREEFTCGPVIDGWYTRLFYGGAERSQEPDLVVADVHTAPTDAGGAMVGWVLHAGTGPLNMAVVTAEVPGVEGSIAFIGPVLSYYEHLSTGFERLTDEAWQTAYAAAPSFRPAFVDAYLADPNGEARGGAALLTTTAVEDAPEAPEAPATAHLTPNYPNPFRTSTVIGFTVPSGQAYDRVEVAVFNVQGQQVRHLLAEALPGGHYTVAWDGTLNNGAPAASGLYFCRLRVGDVEATRPLTLVR